MYFTRIRFGCFWRHSQCVLYDVAGIADDWSKVLKTAETRDIGQDRKYNTIFTKYLEKYFLFLIIYCICMYVCIALWEFRQARIDSSIALLKHLHPVMQCSFIFYSLLITKVTVITPFLSRFCDFLVRLVEVFGFTGSRLIQVGIYLSVFEMKYHILLYFIISYHIISRTHHKSKF